MNVHLCGCFIAVYQLEISDSHNIDTLTTDGKQKLANTPNDYYFNHRQFT